MTRATFKHHRRTSAGLSLIELMIGMLLGLIVVGAAIGIFLSNQQTYRATEGLSRVQESMRTAFELMARDIRVAGGNACNEKPANFTNAMTSGTGNWWGQLATSGWASAVEGYGDTTAFDVGGPSFGTSEGDRLSGTAALQVFSGGDGVASVSADSGTVFTINSSDTGFVSGDLLLVCDSNDSALFNATSVSGTSVQHPSSISFDVNSTVSRFNAVRWYIAYNGNDGTSLYRSRVYAGSEQQEEVAADVSGLEFEYLVDGAEDYVDASSVSDWSSVLAVRVTLTVNSPEKVGTDSKVLTRTLVHVVELRNRNA